MTDTPTERPPEVQAVFDDPGQIEATGNLSEGRFTLNFKLGGVEATITFPSEDPVQFAYADILVESLPSATVTVLNKIAAAAQEDDGE